MWKDNLYPLASPVCGDYLMGCHVYIDDSRKPINLPMWKKSTKTQDKNNDFFVFPDIGENEHLCPDMGASYFAKIEQVSVFSTIETSYPQFCTTYPQFAY